MTFGVAIEIGHRPLDVGEVHSVEKAQRGVPQARHDPGAMPRPDL